MSNLRKTPFGPGPIRAVVKRRKELPFWQCHPKGQEAETSVEDTEDSSELT